MASNTTKPCDYPGCGGIGRVLRTKRTTVNDKGETVPDPFDFQTHELCPTCGGAGAVPYQAPKVVEEKKPGFAADHI